MKLSTVLYLLSFLLIVASLASTTGVTTEPLSLALTGTGLLAFAIGIRRSKTSLLTKQAETR